MPFSAGGIYSAGQSRLCAQSPGSWDAGLLEACWHGPPGVWEDVPGMLKAPCSASQHPQPRQPQVIISRQIWRSEGALETKARVITQLRQCNGTRKWVCGYSALQTSCLLTHGPKRRSGFMVTSLLPCYALRVKDGGSAQPVPSLHMSCCPAFWDNPLPKTQAGAHD